MTPLGYAGASEGGWGEREHRVVKREAGCRPRGPGNRPHLGSRLAPPGAGRKLTAKADLGSGHFKQIRDGRDPGLERTSVTKVVETGETPARTLHWTVSRPTSQTAAGFQREVAANTSILGQREGSHTQKPKLMCQLGGGPLFTNEFINEFSAVAGGESKPEGSRWEPNGTEEEIKGTAHQKQTGPGGTSELCKNKPPCLRCFLAIREHGLKASHGPQRQTDPGSKWWLPFGPRCPDSLLWLG